MSDNKSAQYGYLEYNYDSHLPTTTTQKRQAATLPLRAEFVKYISLSASDDDSITSTAGNLATKRQRNYYTIQILQRELSI